MHPAIAQHRQGIARICERYRISRLDVFGSAARGQDFQPERSDADFLVEFAPGSQPGLSVFMGVQSALAQLLGRQVDLIEAGSVRNPFVLQGINSSRETVYAA
jgi:predicted nucleotidyltransferase